MTEALCVNPRCAIYGAHLPNCAGQCGRGCQPRPATIGQLCRTCCNGLGRDATAAAAVHEDLAQDLVTASAAAGGAGTGSHDQRAIAVGIDLDGDIAEHRDKIRNELTNLCRLVHEETGIELPEPGWRIVPLPRGHHGPARRVQVHDSGLAYLGAWLKVHRAWIAALPAAGKHCATLARIVDDGQRKQDRAHTAIIELGPCPRCTGTLKAVVRRDNPIPSDVTCTGQDRHRWTGERHIAGLGREVGTRDGWLTQRDICRRYNLPLGTVKRWVSLDRWRRTEDGQRPTLYHPGDVDRTFQHRREAA